MRDEIKEMRESQNNEIALLKEEQKQSNDLIKELL